jgi:hypothetical protein
MRIRSRLQLHLLAGIFLAAFQPSHGSAFTEAKVLRSEASQTKVKPDGQHDFDFEIGTWKTHLRFGMGAPIWSNW